MQSCCPAASVLVKTRITAAKLMRRASLSETMLRPWSSRSLFLIYLFIYSFWPIVMASAPRNSHHNNAAKNASAGWADAWCLCTCAGVSCANGMVELSRGRQTWGGRRHRQGAEHAKNLKWSCLGEQAWTHHWRFTNRINSTDVVKWNESAMKTGTLCCNGNKTPVLTSTERHHWFSPSGNDTL